MPFMDTKAPPLPPPSDVPRTKIPTGGGSLEGMPSLRELWIALRRLLRRS